MTKRKKVRRKPVTRTQIKNAIKAFKASGIPVDAKATYKEWQKYFRNITPRGAPFRH